MSGRKVPLLSLEGSTLIYCRDARAAELHLSTTLRHQNPLGFDIEWEFSYVKGTKQRKTALIQLHDGSASVLFHVVHFAYFPEPLKEILTDQHRVKVGLNANGDMQKIRRDFGVQMRGVVELKSMARRRISSSGNWTLAELSFELLHRSLDKDARLRNSKWEARQLTKQQQTYAGLDAFASLRCFEKLRVMPIRTSVGGSISDFCGVLPLAGNKFERGGSKLAAYQLWCEGKSVDEVGMLCGIQSTTAASYIASAIEAGRPYDMTKLGLTCTVLDAVEHALGGGNPTNANKKDVKCAVQEIYPEITWTEVVFALAHFTALETKIASNPVGPASTAREAPKYTKGVRRRVCRNARRRPGKVKLCLRLEKPIPAQVDNSAPTTPLVIEPSAKTPSLGPILRTHGASSTCTKITGTEKLGQERKIGGLTEMQRQRIECNKARALQRQRAKRNLERARAIRKGKKKMQREPLGVVMHFNIPPKSRGGGGAISEKKD